MKEWLAVGIPADYNRSDKLTCRSCSLCACVCACMCVHECVSVVHLAKQYFYSPTMSKGLPFALPLKNPDWQASLWVSAPPSLPSMGYCPMLLQDSSVCTPCFQGFGLRTKNSPREHCPRIRTSCIVPCYHRVLRKRSRMRLGQIRCYGGARVGLPMLEYWNVCVACVLISYLDSGTCLRVHVSVALPVHLHMEAHFILL